MIKVNNEVKVYELDGNDIANHTITLNVTSHWNYNERVNLVIDGYKYTVIGKDLITAINNAMNSNRY